MPDYRRVWLPGGTFFFTLVTYRRMPIFQEEWARDLLRESFVLGRKMAGPFEIVAMSLMPEHLHCIWTLPDQDSDYSTRWKIIKGQFSRQYRKKVEFSGCLSQSKREKGEVGIWQRRFWEHSIRDLNDLNRHIDYVHYNPVKHGLVESVKEWPWSTFHRYVKEGIYDEDWGSTEPRWLELGVGE